MRIRSDAYLRFLPLKDYGAQQVENRNINIFRQLYKFLVQA